jgi:leucyl-tRNA synthetase
MTPHLAEELWEQLGHRDGLSVEPWPQFREDLARENEVEVVIQINGKVRGKLTVPAGASQDKVVALAKADAGAAAHLANKEIRKIIFVPDKLINLVVS